MSSPWRISCRARDSSNKAAKFSWDGAGWLVVAVAMSNRCPIALSVATGVTAGSVGHPVAWRLPSLSSDATALCCPSFPAGACCQCSFSRSRLACFCKRRCALALALRTQRPELLHHEGDACVDRHVGRIQDDCVGGGSKRRCRAGAVTRIPFPDLTQKTGKCNWVSFFYQLLITAPRPLFGACRDINLGQGVGKDHRSHVAAIRNQAGRTPERPLPGQQCAPDLGEDGDLGRR